MTALFHLVFASQGLRYNVSSVNANVAEYFCVTLELEAANAEEVVAVASFTSVIRGVFAQRFDMMFPPRTLSMGNQDVRQCQPAAMARSISFCFPLVAK